MNALATDRSNPSHTGPSYPYGGLSEGPPVDWRGEFVDRDLEQAFREQQWPLLRRRIRIAAAVSLLAILLSGISDYFSVGGTSALFHVLMTCNIVHAVGQAIIIGALSRKIVTRRGAVLGLASQLLLTAVLLQGVLLLPTELAFHFIGAVVIVLISFLYLPLPIWMVLTSTLFLSVGFMLEAILATEADSKLLAQYATVLVAVWTIGLFGFRQTAISERHRFALISNLKTTAARLKSEVSFRNEVENMLRAQADGFKTIFEACPLPLVLISEADGMVMSVNRACANLIGAKPQELQGRNSEQYVEDPVLLKVHRDMVRAKKEMDGTELAILAADGSKRHVLLSTRLIFLEDKACFLTCMTDISGQKKQESLLEQARQEAERANRAKSAFIANMSHELRTPLNAIIGFSDIMMDAETPLRDIDRYTDYSADINYSARHLLEIINDVLDISKIEAGEYRLEKADHSAIEIIDAAVRIVANVAVEKNIRIVRHAENADAQIFVDGRVIRQVLVNLLSNAVKFSDSDATVTVGLEIRDDTLCLIVEDTGIGMSPKDIERVFQPFVQLNADLDRLYEGTGLGLSISKRFVELHGGSFVMTSEINEGTRAEVRLPARVGLSGAMESDSYSEFGGI